VPPGSRNKLKVPAVGAVGARGPLRLAAPVRREENRATPRASTAPILRDLAPSGHGRTVAPSGGNVAPRPIGSIDRALREALAAMGPLLLAVEATAPPEVAPFATGLVATPAS
jgi:hypothetical protein